VIKKTHYQFFYFFEFSVLFLLLFIFPFYLATAQTAPAGLAEEIRNLTELGKLSSMLQALELIRNRDIASSEFGRVMAGINILLIKFVYPDSLSILPSVDLPQTHYYTSIIREAEKGIYLRPSQISVDFFEHILPFLSVNDQTRNDTFADILRDLAKAGQLKPNSLLPHYFQGIIHERANRLDQAEISYRRAFEISSECYPALTGVARIKNLHGNTAEAVSILSDLMVRYPDSSVIKRQLAATYYENHDWSRAMSMIDAILLSEPRNGDLLLKKAGILIEQAQFSQANTVLDTYASINSNNRDYLFLRARVQAEGYRNRDSSLNYLRSVLRNYKDDEEAMIYAARLLMESQRPEDQLEGRELLGRLRQIAGSSVNVLSLSLNDAINRENWQEAQNLINRILVVRRAPVDLINAYYVEHGLGNNSRALNFARELYEQNTSNNEYVIIYISALIDNNRREEALRLLESRINLSSNGVVKGQYFYLRSRLQPNEEAVLNDLRSSIFEDPRNLDALISMFEIYIRRREDRRAVNYLRQAMATAPDNPRVKRLEIQYSALLDRN
jgi:tetratricopeptide (TPR) repeat protein